ncbi:hypothetical protein B0H34DRAFT_721637 [Crassisporium funariophilum]|nr:hypothetical protein B0H34DRAFT_721637 [Crassisporium funariophilum]
MFSLTAFDGSQNVPPAPVELPARHEKFYLPDSGMSIFQVEGCLYKVHRYFLARESSLFEAMLNLPSPAECQEGDSDGNPIHLQGTTCIEFDALLDFLYNGAFAAHEVISSLKPTSTLYSKKLQAAHRKKIQELECITIYALLSISLRYAFDRITKVAISIIDSFENDIAPIEKIRLAIKHDVLRHWVVNAYRSLVARGASLTLDESQKLGFRKVTILAAAREDILRGTFHTDNVPFPPDGFYFDD